MKSLDEVIKYKLNFLPEGIDPFYAIPTYTGERGAHARQQYYNLYLTKNNVFSNESYSFMDDITPLFTYISSCEEYYRERSDGRINDILIDLIMEGEYERKRFCFSTIYNYREIDSETHKISKIKERRNEYFRREGFCAKYVKPFRILFKGGFNYLLTRDLLQLERESREAEEAYRGEMGMPELENFELRRAERFFRDWNPVDNNSSSEEEKLTINDFRTFKVEQCVICLDNTPNVLFCNCGHLCVCETCNVNEFTNCPLCKKENTILRII